MRHRCAHLDALAQAMIGVPLGPAASFHSSSRSRGRHGNALQWHLGLAAHDSVGLPDWEGRIEIKLVSVWRRASGAVVCDKVKICDAGIDPWAKLANVLWVFADRLTRVIVSCSQTWLGGAPRLALAEAWRADPHFDDPPLFVEAREQRSGGELKRAPAYYLAGRVLAGPGLADEGLLPPAEPGVFPFDPVWWRDVRAEHGRDPVTHVATTLTDEASARQGCRRCGGPITFDPQLVHRQGWAPARHGMPIAGSCAVRGHMVVDPANLVAPRVLTPTDLVAVLEEHAERDQIWRLFDHVPEPSDHMH